MLISLPQVVCSCNVGQGSLSQRALAHSVLSTGNDCPSFFSLNSSVLPDPAQIVCHAHLELSPPPLNPSSELPRFFDNFIMVFT